MKSMPITINNTLLYTGKLLRKQILNVLPTEKKQQLCEVMEVLVNTIIVLIFQYLSVSNQQVIYFKFKQCHVSIISL